MLQRILPIGILLLTFPCTSIEAKGAQTFLVSDDVLRFPGIEEQLVEQTLLVQGKGSSMRILYSSDQELAIQVSFLADRAGKISFNPLESLYRDAVPAGENQEIMMDLTRSPAWNTSREEYLLHVRGPDGASVQIHDIDVLPATIFSSFAAIFHHISVREPMQLSSINYLHGYKVWGVSLSLILGAFLLVLVVLLLVLRSKTMQKQKSALVLLFCLTFLFYSARFSFDLLTLTVDDVRSWVSRSEYRQFGPIYRMIDRLQDEQERSFGSISVALCFPWDDIYLKQLRYHLYPIPVRRAAESQRTATHLIFLGMDHRLADGTISCGDGAARKAELVEDFSDGSAIYRFTDSNV